MNNTGRNDEKTIMMKTGSTQPTKRSTPFQYKKTTFIILSLMGCFPFMLMSVFQSSHIISQIALVESQVISDETTSPQPSRRLSQQQPQQQQKQQQPEQNLHVVISHCDQPIDWIWKHYLYGLPYKSITILSKCGKPPTKDQLPPSPPTQSSPPPLIQVITLPNVGRCDHSYAYWIAKMLGENSVDMFTPYTLHYTSLSQEQFLERNQYKYKFSSVETINPYNRTSPVFDSIQIQPDDFILFMKDNDNAYRAIMDEEVPLKTMIQTLTINNNNVNESHNNPTVDRDVPIHNSSTVFKNQNSTSSPKPSTTVHSKRKKRRPKKGDDAKAAVKYVHQTKNDHKSIPLPQPPKPTFVCATRLTHKFKKIFNKRRKRNNPDTYDEVVTNFVHRNDLWQFVQDAYVSSAGMLDRKNENVGQFTSEYRPMGSWIQYLDSRGAFEPNFYHSRKGDYDPITSICFGGNFMTSLRAIEESPVQDWSVIVEQLSRGDNIEEGHYMERLWADLLSQPLSEQYQDSIRSREVHHFTDGAFSGVVLEETQKVVDDPVVQSQ
jgi:hypothetical protein